MQEQLKMLIFGFVLFYLTSVTTLETDSDVKVRLFDNQNAPSTDIVKFLIHTFERKIKEIEKNLKHIQNIERKLTVHFTDYLNGIADKLVKDNAQQDNMIQSVDEMPDDRTPKDDLNEEKEKGIEFRPTDCGEMYSKRGNGIYTLFPNSSSSSGYSVYCDFETDNGNWTVFQRRINGTTDFFRGWEEYENGFGNLEAEFWLGNRKINELTSNGLHELRVDLTDFDGNSAYAKYSRFSVGDASTQYRLEVGGYSGNIGNSLKHNNGMSFTTKDRENDLHYIVNCANDRGGAWWYHSCTSVNLNGQYLQGGQIDLKSIHWYMWKASSISLKSSVMMFRKVYPSG